MAFQLDDYVTVAERIEQFRTKYPAPVAGADDNKLVDFINDLRYAGLNVTEDNQAEAIAIGLGVCVDLYHGFPLKEEYRDLVANGVSEAQAADFLTATVVHLCPDAVPAGGVQ